MAHATVRCETPEALFQTLVEDVLHATCTPLEKRLAAIKLVRFCTHPEQALLLSGRDLSGVNPPEGPEEPEEPDPELAGVAQAFGLRIV